MGRELPEPNGAGLVTDAPLTPQGSGTESSIPGAPDDPGAPDEGRLSTEGVGVPRVPEKARDIRSVDELLRFAYAQEGKRFSVPAAVFEMLEHHFDPDVDHLDLAMDLAASDPLLAVPPRMLVAIESTRVDGPLRRRLIEILGRVIQAHFSCADPEVRVALNGAAFDREHVIAAVRSACLGVKSSDLAQDGEEVKEATRDRLRVNALTAVGLYLALHRRWGATELVEFLDQALWQEERRRIKGTTSLAVLADSRTPEALGVVAEVFARKLREADRRVAAEAESAASAARHMHDAQRELDATTLDLDRVGRELAETKAAARRLAEALEEERRDRVYDRAHHVDDYEHLRARTVRMLEEQIDLLAKAIHASQNGHTSVTEEFVERVLDQLTGAVRDMTRREHD